MLPKSQRRAYVGYDEGSKSILYYNAAMRNILTLRNFHFLTRADPSPLEELGIQPSAPLEGELEDGTCSAAPEMRTENPRKWKAQVNIDPREP